MDHSVAIWYTLSERLERVSFNFGSGGQTEPATAGGHNSNLLMVCKQHHPFQSAHQVLYSQLLRGRCVGVWIEWESSSIGGSQLMSVCLLFHYLY